MLIRVRKHIGTAVSVSVMLTSALPSNAASFINTVQTLSKQWLKQSNISNFSLSTNTFTDPEEYRAGVIFQAETIDDLERAVAQGYPMPWLSEILEDPTIPEEDRYWLDCRMRAAFAIELHTFFNESGNPATINSEWILPGEDYWRESYVVNPPGYVEGSVSILRSSNDRLNPGYTVDRFGEQIGEFAQVGNTMKLDTSRDGTLSAAAFNTGDGYHAVFQYSDGSYYESPIRMSFGLAGLSSSGNYVILSSRGWRDWATGDETSPQVILLDRYGNVIWELELEMIPVGNSRPTISPDDRFCAVCTQAEDVRTAVVRGMLQVFSIDTGCEVWRLENPDGIIVRYSPNGEYLCVSGGNASVFETATGRLVWQDSNVDRSSRVMTLLYHAICSNSADIVSGTIWSTENAMVETSQTAAFDASGRWVVNGIHPGHMDVSPNGIFTVSENYLPYSTPRSITPMYVCQIARGV